MTKITTLTAIFAALALVGCSTGSDGGTASTGVAGSTTTYNVDSGGGDVTINDTTVGENGTYIQNQDGTVTYTSGNDNVFTLPSGEKVSIAGSPSGDYDPTYNAEECAANGYFYCTLENKCLNTPASGGTCTK